MPAHDLFIYVEGENNILQKVWVGGVKSVIFYVNYRSTPLLPGVEHWIIVFGFTLSIPLNAVFRIRVFFRILIELFFPESGSAENPDPIQKNPDN